MDESERPLMNLRAHLSKIDAIRFENIDLIGTVKSFIIKNIPNHIITIILSQNTLLKSQWPGMLVTSSGRTETIKRLRIRIQHQARAFGNWLKTNGQPTTTSRR